MNYANENATNRRRVSDYSIRELVALLVRSVLTDDERAAYYAKHPRGRPRR